MALSCRFIQLTLVCFCPFREMKRRKCKEPWHPTRVNSPKHCHMSALEFTFLLSLCLWSQCNILMYLTVKRHSLTHCRRVTTFHTSHRCSVLEVARPHASRVGYGPPPQRLCVPELSGSNGGVLVSDRWPGATRASLWCSGCSMLHRPSSEDHRTSLYRITSLKLESNSLIDEFSFAFDFAIAHHCIFLVVAFCETVYRGCFAFVLKMRKNCERQEKGRHARVFGFVFFFTCRQGTIFFWPHDLTSYLWDL